MRIIHRSWLSSNFVERLPKYKVREGLRCWKDEILFMISYKLMTIYSIEATISPGNERRSLFGTVQAKVRRIKINKFLGKDGLILHLEILRLT